jgi:hypothetical protein
MIPSKKLTLALLIGVAFAMAACSGVKGGSTSGGSGSGGSGGTATTFTIGGSVVGLTGTGLVLEDNGADDLTITGTGTVSFKFKTAVTNYTVTVKTQPTNPTQVCSVSNASGKATANVTNVQVSCGVVYSVGGTISGLLGTGLVLNDTVGTFVDSLPITATGNSIPFTFATPVAGNSTYTVTVGTQPSAPAQKCSVTNGSGTATGNVTSIEVVCPAPTFTIGGTLVGLVNGTGNTVELQNNGGDNIFVTGNNSSFVFPTAVTDNGAYNVSLFFGPTSQPQPCWLFYYLGVATADVNTVIVDCQHNDWTWIFGPKTNGTSLGTYGTGGLPPPPPPTQDPNTPGGRDYPTTWTDKGGQLWLFGGYGLPVTGVTPPLLPGLMNDLWVFSPAQGIWIPANLPITRTSSTTSGVTTVTDVASTLPLQYTDGSYAGSGSNGAGPGARWGSVSWTDATSGDLYMFGGQGYSGGGIGLLNDLWKFHPGPIFSPQSGSYDVSLPPTSTLTYTGSYTYTGTWTAISGALNVDTGGNYGAGVGSAGTPGGRWGAASCTDATGTVWMFGGQGFDSTATVGLLNDLWKYSGGQWTWMGPSNSNKGQNNGAYGTPGTAATGNAPGGRQTAVLWADNNGHLWLFGGLGLDSAGTQNPGSLNGGLPNGTVPEGALLNDLWRYDISTGDWAWMSGGGTTGLANQVGVYGTSQTAAAANMPGSRWSAAGWSDSGGNLWFFGGWGYASSLAQSTGFLNDIWEYLPGTGQWIWWKGSSNVNQNGNYPTQFSPSYYVPFVQNQPGARRGMGFWQPDSLDYVWMFGGQGYDSTSSSGNGYENDFWRYLGFPKYPNQ